VIAWRITKPKYPNPLDGSGARQFGGRWNPPGIAVIYLASTESLARLESLADVLMDRMPERLLHRIEVPDASVSDLDGLGVSLPRGWDAVPAPPATAELGGNWLSSNRSLALKVPSVQSTSEWNVLVNPAHPDFGRVQVLNSRRISFDRRHVPQR
jgi:RES domain-containing protein